MNTLHRICVYCGSNPGYDSVYANAARALGAHLAQSGLGLVYGGGRVGLMGIIADAVLENDGEVFGVIPEKLQDLELGHEGVTRLEVVPSMHDRKLRMAELADAFIAMPGGFGTLEEISEVTTWTQLNYHLKPVGLLNVNGFYDHLLKFIAHAHREGFIREPHRNLIQSATTPRELVELLRNADIPKLEKWLEKP